MRHLLTSLAVLATFAAAGQPADSCSLPTTAAGLFDGDDHVWLTDADFLNFGQTSFTIHVRFRPTDLSNLVECCGYQTLIAKGASGGNGDKGFNIDLRGEPDDARVKCRLTTATGVDVILTAPIVQNEWYDLVFVVDWISESATLFLNGAMLDEGSLEGLGDPNTDWYTSVGRFVWDNDGENDNHFFRGEMSWLRIQNEADYQLGQVPCSPRENSLFELTEFTAEEVAAQVSSTFAIDEVITTMSPCDLAVSGDGLSSCISGDGLLGWWPFTGNALDESENGYNGLVEGATLTENRYNEIESAYLFDGDDRITTSGSPFDDLDSFTISTWFQSDNPSPYSVLVSEWPGGGATFKLDHSTENEFLRFDLVTSDGFYSNTVDFAPQQILGWTHFAAVYDGVGIHIYINGISTGDAMPASGFVSSTSGVLMIGDEQNNSAPFQGKIDDLAIWARALSAEEVETLHASRFLSFMPILDLGEDIETCEDSVILDAGEGFGSYHWSTGETSQTITVSESGLYEATVSAHPANEWSLSFDGQDDYVSLGEQVSFDGDFTLSALVQLDDAGLENVHTIFSKSDETYSTNGLVKALMLEVYQQHLNFGYRTENNSNWSQISSDIILEYDQWYLLSVTRYGSDVRLYVNGVESGVGQFFGDIEFPNSVNTYIGRHWNGDSNFASDYHFEGLVDFLILWDVALSQTEIEQSIGCVNHVLHESIVGHWTFEDHGDNLVTDASDSGNNGTVFGAFWSHQASEQDCPSCESSDEILVVMPNCDGYCGEGTVWDEDLQECMSLCETESDSAACGEGTVWDPFNQECIVAIPTDTDFDGCVAAGDLLNLLGTFGSCPPIPFSDPCQEEDHVTYQGYDYDIVAIGDQCWFAENLRAENYRNGDVVPSNFSNVDWSSLSSGAFSIYGANETCNNISPTIDSCDPLVAQEVYGLLYNWYVIVDSRGVCPDGWHVPTDSDWTILSDGLGGTVEAGDKIKSSEGWCDGCEGTNSTGFNGLASGRRSVDGVSSTAAGVTYENAGGSCQWWSASSAGENESANAISRGCDGNSVFNVDVHDSRFGFSIRCIKDQ